MRDPAATSGANDPDPQLCRGCGYDLRGLDSACPECGRAFDARDLRTYAQTGAQRRLEWLLRPHPIVHVPAVLLFVWMWIAISVPGGYFWMVALGLMVGVALFAIWTIWLLSVWIYLSRTNRRPSAIGPRGRLAMLAFPLLAGLGVLAASFDLPLWSAFLISRPAMEQLAQATMAGQPPGAPTSTVPQRQSVGVYTAANPEAFPAGSRFTISGAGFMARCGFAYSPSGAPPALSSDDHYEHFSGPWYIWVNRW